MNIVEELQKIEWQISHQLSNLRLLLQEVRRNSINESTSEKMPTGVVDVDLVHRVIDIEVEKPQIESIGRNMNEEY